MPEFKLKTVTRTQGNNRALKDGSVKPRTFAFDFEEVDPLIAAFRRMVRGNEFDICEMAITTYICAKAHGKPMTAVPVFLVRAFHHGATVVNAKSGIRTPKELEGRNVGVNRGYTVTTGVWARSVLQDEHGVDVESEKVLEIDFENGRPVRSEPFISRMKAPLLILIAGADQATTPEQNQEFMKELTAAGVPYESHVYEGAPHSFFDRAHEQWRDACDDAWRRMLEFVKKHS